MTPASLFAARLGRLLSLLVRQPDALDAHRAIAQELLALNEDPITLTWENWELRTGSTEVLGANTPGVLELLSRMAAHGIRELAITAGADRGHLVGVVGVLAQDPVIGDGGANAMARLAMLGADTVRVVPVIDPDESLEDEISSQTPAVAQRETTERRAAAEAVTVAKAVPATVYEPPAAAAPEIEVKETAELLVARLGDAQTNDEIARALDAMATFTEQPRKRLADVVTILLGLIAAEPRFTASEPKQRFGWAVGRIAKATLFRSLASDLPRSLERRADYLKIFRYFGDAAADQLIEALAHADSAKERRVLFDALVELRRGVATLISLLGDERWYVVRNAAELLGEMRAVEAQQGLAWLLSHGEPRVRRSASSALAKLETPGARAALKEALKDAHPGVRAHATLAFASPKQRDSLPTLLRALTEEQDHGVQAALMMALTKLGTPEAMQHVVTSAEPEKGMFKKKPTPLRLAAIAALAESTTPAAKATIQALTKDKEREVRDAATRALTPARGMPVVKDATPW